MLKYQLEEDKLIGHKLIEEKKSLGQRKFSLKDVSYNGLIERVTSNLYQVCPENLYGEIHYSIRDEIEFNIFKRISFLDGGKPIGGNRLEKRINNLRFKLTDSYLKKALKILEGLENSS